MTAPLQLVTDRPSPTQIGPESSGPSPADKQVIAEYIKEFKARGFCKIDDASSNSTRLYNRFNQRLLPLSFIENDFRHWLHQNGKECEQVSTSYLIRTLRHVVGPIFVPEDKPFIKEQDTGCTFTNTYRKYQPKTDSTELSPLFLQLFERLAPDPEERHTLIQWLAHIFQRPEQRPSWHVMLPSATGTGKGFLFQKILHPLLIHTQVLNSYSKLTGQFSTSLESTLLVLLDDAKSGSDAQQTQLKSLLSEEQAYVERKNMQGGMVNTFTRFILASNEVTPLDFESNERRWLVLTRIEHLIDGDETAAFIGELDEWLDIPGALDAVYSFFMTYPLDGFNHKRVAQSAALLEMIKKSKGIYADFLQTYIIDHVVFKVPELLSAYDFEFSSHPSTKQLPALLASVGYVNSQKVIKGKKTRICHPEAMSLGDIRAACRLTAI